MRRLDIESKIIEMEAKKFMLDDYIIECENFNKEHNTDTMEGFIEKAEEAVAKCNIIIKDLKSMINAIEL